MCDQRASAGIQKTLSAVLVLVLGHIWVFGGELLVQLLEGVGDVFEEDEPEINVLVPVVCLNCSSKPRLPRPFFFTFGAVVAMMRHHSVVAGRARRRVVGSVRLSVGSIPACSRRIWRYCPELDDVFHR
jgi:hypothetical protein